MARSYGVARGVADLILTFGCVERDIDLELEVVVEGLVEHFPVDREASATDLCVPAVRISVTPSSTLSSAIDRRA